MASSLDQLLRPAKQRLAATAFEAPPREAALLLGHLLGYTEAQILARGDEIVDESLARRFQNLLERRLQGEPVAYLLGRKEFFGRLFRVDERVLIPRPETEHLVEAALEVPLTPEARILDIGTGSGCLAITLALERPGARVTATDASLAALAAAARNVQEHGVADRVHLAALDLSEGLELAPFDLVVSNPPYVDPADFQQLSVEIHGYEPHRALFADQGGLKLLYRLLDQARRLRRDVPLMLEIGFGQIEAIRRGAEKRDLEVTRVISDYGGIPRTVVITHR